MFKNRFPLVLGVISLVLVSLAVSNFNFKALPARSEAASDFYQRHPDWIWTVNRQNAIIPITGEDTFPDYFQRHPELTTPAILGLGASDYFMRHPELVALAEDAMDMTDYYFRQRMLAGATNSVDLTDYYFRHIVR